MGPRKGEDGKYSITFNMGTSALGMVSVEDIGNAVANIFVNQDLIGKEIGFAAEFMTGYQIASLFSKTLGIDCYYNDIDDEAYRNLGFPGAKDMGNMFAFFRTGSEMLKKKERFGIM